MDVAGLGKGKPGFHKPQVVEPFRGLLIGSQICLLRPSCLEDFRVTHVLTTNGQRRVPVLVRAPATAPSRGIRDNDSRTAV